MKNYYDKTWKIGELAKIWDRFYKSDSSRGKDRKGSGLGLSIVRDILRRAKDLALQGAF